MGFIQSIMNIPIKNSYIKQFIDVFSREPFDGEDERYLYTKNSLENYYVNTTFIVLK